MQEDCDVWGLFRLEKRQVRGVAIEICKMMHGMGKVDKEKFLSLLPSIHPSWKAVPYPHTDQT